MSAARKIIFAMSFLFCLACNNLTVFDNYYRKPSIERISSYRLNEDGYLELGWAEDGNIPLGDYTVYLQELPKNDTSYPFTEEAIVNAPLTAETIMVDFASSPRFAGQAITTTGNRFFVVKSLLKPNTQYLLDLSPKAKSPAVDKVKVIHLHVGSMNIDGAFAEVRVDKVHVQWQPVPGANRYEVFADQKMSMSLGSTTDTSIELPISDSSVFKEYFIRSYRGDLASADYVLAKLVQSSEKIVAVRALTPNGFVKEDEEIDFKVEFSAPVTVYGTSSLSLKMTSHTRQAVYVSGSGTDSLIFRYKVQASDDTTLLSSEDILAGSYVDALGLNISSALPKAGTGKSLSELSKIALDTTPPTAASSVGFPGAVSPTSSVSVSFAASSDSNFLTHHVKLCSASDCTGSCTVPIDSPTSPATALGNVGTFYYACVQGEDKAGHLSAWINSTGTVIVNGNGPSITSLPATQNAFTGSAITAVDSNQIGGLDVDADGDALSYSCRYDLSVNSSMDSGGTACTSLPSTSYSFSSSTGVFNWTPSASASSSATIPSSYEIEITASDLANQTAKSYFVVNVLKTFDTTIPFTASTSSSYNAFDTSALDFSGNFVRLKKIDQLDSELSADGFVQSSLNGTNWVSASNAIRLESGGYCTGLGAHCTGIPDSASWTPNRSTLIHNFEMGDMTGFTTASAATTPTFGMGYQKIWLFGSLYSGSHYTTRARDFADDFSMSIWFRTSQSYSINSCAAWSDGVALVSADAAGDVNDFSSFMCDGYVSFGVGNPSRFVKSTARFNDNIYHQLTMTRNKTSGQIAMYIDGDLQGTATGNNASLNASPDLYLGARSPGDTQKYVGNFDEFYIWTSILDAAQVRTLFERQRTGNSGNYYSRIMDSKITGSSWTGLTWTSTLPAGKELPDYSGGIQNETNSSYSALNSGSLMNSIVGLWHLNEESTGTVSGPKDFKDSSGSDNHGVLQNTAELGKYGRLHNAVAFKEQGEIKIESPSAALAFGSGTFTIAAWFRTGMNVQTRSRIISSGFDTQSNGFSLEINGGKFAFGIGCGGLAVANCFYTTTSASFIDNRWHLAVAVVDRTAQTVQLFVDGTLRQQNIVATIGNCGTGSPSMTINISSCTSLNATGGDVYFGSKGTTNRFYGSIDEVAMWKRNLSAAEAMELFRRGAHRLYFQIRACSTSNCSSGVWKGPDGTGSTFFTEIHNNSNPTTQMGTVLASPPIINFADFPSLGAVSGRYFQYSVLIESDEGVGPALTSVEAGPFPRYDGTKPFIVYETALNHRTFSSLSESFGGETCAAGLKYQVSTDNTNWKYFNGTSWAVADTNLKTNTAQELADNAPAYALLVGLPSSFYLKTFFNTSGSTPCGIDDLIIHSNRFY